MKKKSVVIKLLIVVPLLSYPQSPPGKFKALIIGQDCHTPGSSIPNPHSAEAVFNVIKNYYDYDKISSVPILFE